MSIILTFIGVLLMWTLWISVFMHQKNPIISPLIEKDVLDNL